MSSRWTLVVEGLGRIERAEIRTSPLLLLVGQNDTGKSHLASVLWGLQMLPADFFDEDDLATEAGQRCVAMIDDAIDNIRRGLDYRLTGRDVAAVIALLNATLDRGIDDFAQLVFNTTTVPIRRIHVDDLEITDRPEITVESAKYLENLTIDHTIRAAILAVLVCDLLGASTPDLRTDPLFHAGDPIFLPASRTGFVLLHKAVAGSQLRRLFTYGRTTHGRAIDLPSPAIHFLSLLSVGLKPERGPFAAEADFLERRALEGTLELRAQPTGNELAYRAGPERERAPLPLAFASSLVAELAPIVLTLRHLPELSTLIIEEPEAHLDPSVERLLAWTIVRLVRRGVRVWVTTHSETFCQQVNNFIKLGAHRDRAALQQRLGYEPDDYLLLDEVSGHQLELGDDGKAVVSELAKSPRGLTMPAFDDARRDLARETLALEAGGDEDGGGERV